MNVSLTPQLEEMIRAKVASGMYSNASEVVREALRLLAEKDRDHLSKVEALRSEVQKGLDALDSGNYSVFPNATEATRNILDKVLKQNREKNK